MAMAALYYVTDPMCSWCWGFAPVIQEIERRAPVRYVMGGLAPDSDEPMPEAVRTYVQEAWDAVERATGAHFNREFWARCTPRRSTHPACRAVLVAESQAPGAGPRMFRHIQRAYYLEARNPSDVSTLVELAAEQGLDAARFAADLDLPATRARLAEDLALRDRLGAHSFPSLVRESGGETRVLMRGWTPAAEVLARLEAEGVIAATVGE